MSASIGRVFFSKEVALPFMKFRMLRNGYLRSPIRWEEIQGKVRGLLSFAEALAQTNRMASVDC